MELMKANAFITQNELAKLTGLSTKAIEKNIRLLKTEGLIERVGSDKSGHWKLML
jgi:ATP-dependent DNA helicase RecG